MRGGSLPAQTWDEIMAFSHQGVELRPIPGIAGSGPTAKPAVAEAKREGMPEGGRPSILTKRGTEALLRIEKLMDDAARVLATTREPSKTTDARAAAAQASAGAD